MIWDGFAIKDLWDPEQLLGAVILAAVVFIAAWVINRLLSRAMGRSQWVMGKLGRHVDETMVRFAVRVKTVLLYLIAAAFYASLIPGLRGLLGTVVAGAGVTAIVVGFAAKSSLANLVSGISLAIYRPFRIGDKVNLEGEFGTIEDITLRHTIMRTWENKRLIIPNEKIDSMSLLNHSILDPQILCRVEVGVSYDSDIDLVRRLLLEVLSECPYKLPDDKAPEPPRVRVVDLKDFSIEVRMYCWVADINQAWSARFWLLEQAKKRFDAEGVEIPFPYRTLVYKKDLPPARREQAPQEPPPEESS